MKILQTVFSISDYGGIVNHVENLARGFRDLGHECDLVLMKDDALPPRVKKVDTHIEGTYDSVAANKVNTIYGWYGAKVIGYFGEERIDEWRALSSQYDVVVHQLPAPRYDSVGWWRRIYEDCEAPQIAIAHDAHFRDMYPHMIEIAKHLVGVSVTNPAGYAALSALPAPRVFIGAPHVPQPWNKQPSWKKRPRRFVSAHVWKAWKRMDRVLRALPHIKSVDNLIGGDGIEARYMRSKDKCKPRYKGLWRSAQRAGMKYVGLIPSETLMAAYERSRLMVDLSFSEKFAALGNHFNRSTIEAYNGGCVPMCVYENMQDPTGIFRAGEHYLAVTEEWSRDPKGLADAIMMAVSMKQDDADAIVGAGRDLFEKHFDYMVSAQGFIDLAKGRKKIGIYGKTETGKTTPEVLENLRKLAEQASRERISA